MDVVLKVLEGAKEGTKISVKKDKFLIGRSPKCHLCAASTAVSRRHCAIRRKNATVTIKDLGSRNGTLLNGQPITQEVELSSGDEIVVGPLRFLVTITHGINNLKRPQVKTVADAVERTAEVSSKDIRDDDISHWLDNSEPASKVDTETQSIRFDETNTVRTPPAEPEPAEQANPPADEAETAAATTPPEKERGPGKLPPVPPKETTKDS